MKGSKYTGPTIKHAIKYIQMYIQFKSDRVGQVMSNYKAFELSNKVGIPCRAVGLAKKALAVEGWDGDKAINRLSNGAQGL